MNGAAYEEVRLLLEANKYPPQVIGAFHAEVLREAAGAVVVENDRMLWATKPGEHWAADLLRRMADEAEQGQPAPQPATIENYPGELAMLRGVLGVVRSIARHGDLGDTTGGRELRQVIAEHYADERAAYAEQGEKDTREGESTQPELGEFIGCARTTCRRGEWSSKAEERGWEQQDDQWLCPQCAADAADRRDSILRAEGGDAR